MLNARILRPCGVEFQRRKRGFLPAFLQGHLNYSHVHSCYNSYFRFPEPPNDPYRWKRAQEQAASGEQVQFYVSFVVGIAAMNCITPCQVLLKKLVDVFPFYLNFLDGDVLFRRLHALADVFVDDNRDLSVLTGQASTSLPRDLRADASFSRRLQLSRCGEEEGVRLRLQRRHRAARPVQLPQEEASRDRHVRLHGLQERRQRVLRRTPHGRGECRSSTPSPRTPPPPPLPLPLPPRPS